MITGKWWFKLVVLATMTVVSVLYVLPTLMNVDLEKTKLPFKQKINLGLDLQGGLYMVLGVDFNKVFKDTTVRQGEILVESLRKEEIAQANSHLVTEGTPADDPRIMLEFPESSLEKVRDQVKKWGVFRVTAEKKGGLELGLTTEMRSDIRERTINQSIEVIRNRIDEFGVAEPVIQSQGLDRVVVELPGVKEIERAKELIGRTAKLEFRMVDDGVDPAQLQQIIEAAEKEKGFSFKEGDKFSNYVTKLNEAVRGKIPADREIVFEVNRPIPGSEAKVDRIPYLVTAKAEVTGDSLQDASVGVDRENGNRPIVQFSFNPRGAEAFGKLTSENIRKRLAIVLDNIVHSAPVIQSAITGGHGQITLGQGDGNKLMKEAKDLAIVLRAGALPAQLEFQEQRVIGPSLGQDSIKSGAKAGIVGCLLIFVFMIFYYRASGMVAAFSLVLNALFMLAILIGMDATLTLPGIAGIALTIGMAVDSNVIIFERIRDELQEGKAVSAAIQAGFQKAFAAIFDANITHGIIAAILMSYGTGPIRGFAVTLFIGILTTLFCAVTVCKLFFDGYLGFTKEEPKQLSI